MIDAIPCEILIFWPRDAVISWIWRSDVHAQDKKQLVVAYLDWIARGRPTPLRCLGGPPPALSGADDQESVVVDSTASDPDKTIGVYARIGVTAEIVQRATGERSSAG